jgi:hypothetical protein
MVSTLACDHLVQKSKRAIAKPAISRLEFITIKTVDLIGEGSELRAENASGDGTESHDKINVCGAATNPERRYDPAARDTAS